MLDLSHLPEPTGELAAFGALAAEAFGGSRSDSAGLAALREKYSDDFEGFCELLEIIPKETGAGPSPLRLNEIQRAFNGVRSARDIVLKARQLGFTTVEQARDLWFWLMRAGASVVVVCQSSSDHKPRNGLSKRFEVMLASLRKKGFSIPLKADAVGRWALREEDGAAALEIIEAGASAAAAEKKGRSDVVHRLHVTEVAFFEYAGKTLNALLECVPSPDKGSEVVFESTPNGMGGDERGNTEEASGGPYFYWKCRDAQRGLSEYRFHFFSWMAKAEYRAELDPGEVITPQTDRERQVVALGATPEQLKWYRRKVVDKGQDQTDQEYPSDPDTCFLVSGRRFFDKTVTEQMLVECTDPIITREIRREGAVGMVRIWRRPEPGVLYVLPGDTSEGDGGDAGSGQIYERGTGLHCATIWGQFKPAELAQELALLGWEYNTALIAIERNNHGHACILALGNVKRGLTLDAREHQKPEAYPCVFFDRDGKPGWLTTEVSRVAALDAIEHDHRNGIWKTKDRNVVGEFRTFVVNKKGKAEAASGARDDLVLTATIGWDVLRRAAPPQDNGFAGAGSRRWSR